MNIVVAQSGGPTCVINASMLGVFLKGKESDKIQKVYGSLNGIEGLINDNLVDLTATLSEKDVEIIRQTPATVLGSCRYKLPDSEKDSTVYETIVKNMKAHSISAFFYIGGNDSMDTVMKLSKYFKENNLDICAIGVPKTIDNDLVETDHTPGFGSAAKYVTTTMQEIIRDSSVYSIPAVTIVEIMGRDTGWLTASTSLLRVNGEKAPHLIYLPEREFSVNEFLDDIREIQKETPSVIVAVSEGVEITDEEFSGDDFRSGKVDNFGHKYIAGIGRALEEIITNKIGCKVRSIELNVMQRCSSHLASLQDIKEAEKIGGEAVKLALDGLSGKTLVFKRVSINPYKVEISSADVSKIANQVKYFPPEWINEKGNNITDDAIEYFLPLIQGELDIQRENGLPKHYIIKK